MKISITALENNIDSKIDPRFGRCTFFAFYDTETCALDFVPNPNRDANEGAGPASAQFVVSRGVTKVISGEFGGKVKTVFEALGVTMVPSEDQSQTIQSIVNSLKNIIHN